MNNELLKTIWEMLNSPLGITVVVSIVAWVLNKIYAKKPTWKKYSGTIISAIKYAEKIISDDTLNPSMRKLDIALKYAIQIIEHAEKRSLSDKELNELKDAISLIHNDIESKL